MKPIVEIHNLSKKYRIHHLRGGYLSLRERMVNLLKIERREEEDFWALNDISFSVEPGESLGIIGRNGAGKSTLLKILSKITPPTRGKIINRGRIASLLEVGTGFHPELTGRENIFFNGSLLGMKRREISDKFDEIVDFSGVEKFLDTALKHYSSGMQLRLAFAVAAFLEPEILIIDEVLAVGDAEFQKKCLGKMEDVSKRGRTILFVSHNMPVVQKICTRGLQLDNGKVKMYGKIEEVVSAYNAIDAKLLAVKSFSPPKNSISWISYFRFLEKEIPVYEYGEPLTFEIGYESTEPFVPYFGFIVHSADGSNVLNSNNRYQPNHIPSIDRRTKGSIVCDLGGVPLMEGKYFMSLYLGDYREDSHIIEGGVSFEVREKDIWGLGHLPPRRSSHLWWPTSFVLKEST